MGLDKTLVDVQLQVENMIDVGAMETIMIDVVGNDSVSTGMAARK